MAKAKVKVIIKRPDEEYGHVSNISSTLKNLQKTVGGYIETVQVTGKDVILVNEEGKLLGLEKNLRLHGDTVYSETLCGTIVVIGTDGDEFADVGIDFKVWKKLVDKWEGKGVE